jgi:DNA-binding ferritin-like protein
LTLSISDPFELSQFLRHNVPEWVYDETPDRRDDMAKKNRLTDVGKRVGAALGKANKEAHIQARKVSAASKVAKEELKDISKQVEALKKQLEKTAKRLKSALK